MLVVTCNWLSTKFYDQGDHELGRRAGDEYHQLMKRLDSKHSGFTENEVALIRRYLD
jgi:hypothetical protein